jgi:hypothetical protein
MASELNLIEWLAVGAASLFMVALIIGFVFNINSGINDAIQDLDNVPDESKEYFQEKTDSLPGYFDYAFAVALFALAVGCILIARNSNISPIWWWILFVLILLVGGFAAWISNTYAAFDTAGNLNLETNMPITNFIMSNFLIYLLVIGFTSLMISANTRRGAGGL